MTDTMILAMVIKAVDEASAALKQVHGSLDQMGAAAQKAGAMARQADTQVKTMGQGLRGLSGHANTASQSIGGFGQVMTGMLGAMAGGSLMQVGRQAIAAGIGLYSLKQQAEIAFTTMLGDGAKATAMLDDLAAFAATTPFEFPELVTASQQLMAFGFEAKAVKPLLTAVGDAAAGLGRGKEEIGRIILAFGQMKSAGRVMGQELLQLQQTGINANKYLSEGFGVSEGQIRKMTEQGLIPANKAILMIVEGMERDFPAMMNAQSKSMQGLISTAKDLGRMSMETALRPALDWLTTTGLPAAIAQMTRFSSVVTSLGLGGAITQITGLNPQVLALAGAFAATALAAGPLIGLIRGLGVALLGLGGPVSKVGVMAGLLAVGWLSNWRGMRDGTNASIGEMGSAAQRLASFLREHLGTALQLLITYYGILTVISIARFGKGLAENAIEAGRLALAFRAALIPAIGVATAAAIAFAPAILAGLAIAGIAIVATKWMWDDHAKSINNAALAAADYGKVVSTVTGKPMDVPIVRTHIVGDHNQLPQLPGYAPGEDPITALTNPSVLHGLGKTQAQGLLGGLLQEYVSGFPKVQAEINKALGGLKLELPGRGPMEPHPDELLPPSAQQQAEEWQKLLDQLKGSLDASEGAFDDMGKAGKDAGEKTAKALQDVREQIVSALGGVQPLIDKFMSLHPASVAAAEGVTRLKDELAGLQAAQKANEVATQAAQDALRGMQERVSRLSDELSKAKQALSDLVNAPITGQTALDDKLFQMDQALKRLKLQKIQLGPGADTTVLDKQIEEQQRLIDLTRLQGELLYDPQRRAIERAANPPGMERPYQQIIAAILGTKGQINGLEGQLESANAAVKAQEEAIRSLENASRALSEQTSIVQEQLRQQEELQKNVTTALQGAYTWFGKERGELLKLGAVGEEIVKKIDPLYEELLGDLESFVRDQTKTTTQRLNELADALNRVAEAKASLAANLPTHVYIPPQEAAPTDPGLVTGPDKIPGFASGVRGYHGGLAVVGEYGPELVNLPRGANVYSNRELGEVIDYDRLAEAIARQPITIQLDGEKVGHATRRANLRTGIRNGYPNGTLGV